MGQRESNLVKKHNDESAETNHILALIIRPSVSEMPKDSPE
jgi:hypothetical protein